MGIWKPKRTLESDEAVPYGVCLWRLPDGSYIQDDDQNYFCAQAKLHDPATEYNMRNAVKEMGIEQGAPFWLPGFRQISNSEWEDQMDTFLDGGIPDIVDLYRQRGV